MSETQSPCRSDLAGRAKSQGRVPAAMFGLFAVGFWVVSAYMRHIPAADRFATVEAEFDLWVVVVGAVGGYALAACFVFIVRLLDVKRLFQRLDPASVIFWGLAVVVAGGSVFATMFTAGAGAEESIDKQLAMQTRPITLIGGICMAPGLMALLALRSVATDDENWLESGTCRIRLLLRLQHELRRILATLGGFLTVVVVATGLRRRAMLALDPELAVPAEGVLLYGLVFAALLGLFYHAASAAIEDRGRRILDEFAPIPDPAGPDLSEQLGRRVVSLPS